MEKPTALPRPIDSPDSLTDLDIATLGDAVFVTNAPQRADVLFVFGASNGQWDIAAQLFHAGLAPVVLATGRASARHGVPATPEAHLIRDDLVARGVPAENILVEAESTNTLENVRFGQRVLAEQGVVANSIVFVTKSHHAGRAQRTLARWLPGVHLSCATYDMHYDGVAVRRADWWRHAVSCARVRGEYERILRYAARGDIDGAALSIR